MVSKVIKVKNVTGIHLRAANAVCNTAVKYSSLIKMKKKEQVVNAKSILGILSACIRCDDEIIIECEGVARAYILNIYALLEEITQCSRNGM